MSSCFVAFRLRTPRFRPALSWSKDCWCLPGRPAHRYAPPIEGAAQRKGTRGRCAAEGHAGTWGRVVSRVVFRALWNNPGLEEPSGVYPKGDSSQGPAMSTVQHPVSSLLQHPRPLFRGRISACGSPLRGSEALLHLPPGLRQELRGSPLRVASIAPYSPLYSLLVLIVHLLPGEQFFILDVSCRNYKWGLSP